MFSFIKDFTPEERDYFWRPFPQPSTVCRMSFSLRDYYNKQEIYQISCNSIATKGSHAEVVAYDSIQEEFVKFVQIHSFSSSYLDFIIALNNSPCSSCRKRIIEWTNCLLKFIPLRLVLLFSNLYGSEGETEDRTVSLFIEWILKLVEAKVVVVISPIIVHKMVPEIDSDFDTLLKITRNDYESFKKFLAAIKKIKARKSLESFFDYFESKYLNRHKHSIPLKLFSWDSPQYISIYPKDRYYLSLLDTPQRPRASCTRSVSCQQNPRRKPNF